MYNHYLTKYLTTYLKKMYTITIGLQGKSLCIYPYLSYDEDKVL